MEQYVIGIDVGGTNIKAGAVDYQGNILTSLRVPTETGAGSEAILDKLKNIVTQLETSVKDRTLVAVGFGIPGAIQSREGIVTQAPNFPALNGMPIRQLLTEGVQKPCFIENDANAIAFGEMWVGAGQGFSHILCLVLGTGVGGGVIIDGELLRGTDGMAGELGHVAVEMNGPQCNCRSFGCLEMYSSATGILRMYREQISNHSDSSLRAHPQITPAIVYEEASKGDQFARSLFQQVGHALGVGMASFVNIFNPEILIIGGGIASAWEFFVPEAIETMKKRAFQAPVGRVKIARAEKESDAGIVGCAYLAWDELRRGESIRQTGERRLAPWGFWQVLEESKDYKVKRIYVHAGHRLSYQKHSQREETWMIFSGTASVTVDDKDITLEAGHTIHIGKTQRHRIANKGTTPLIFIEVQRGTYFGEDDIVRLQDDYKRN
ncbi:MAG TPA: ROK family protein [Acidobacteriota bacterium]|nr:ROK family protein [Acidobacteriota bacterium]